MRDVLIGGLAFLVFLGFEKAILEPVAKQLFRRAADKFIRALPGVYERVESLIPEMISATMPPAAFEGVVRGALEEVTGESWARSDFLGRLRINAAVEEFFRCYDPRIAAEKLNGRVETFSAEDPFDSPLPVALTPPVES